MWENGGSNGECAMKSATWFGLAVAAAVLAGGAARGESVDQGVARGVAIEAVEQFFPGESWVAVDGVEIRDGEGGRAAWGFVFALEGSAQMFQFPEVALKGALAAGVDGTDGESELYASTATVVTGGKDTDSLVFRTFRGLADWYQEGLKSGWKGEVVRVGPGDIRWAAEAPSGARGAGKGAAVRKAAAAWKATVAEEREGWSAERRDAEAEAQAEAEAAAKARWAAVRPSE